MKTLKLLIATIALGFGLAAVGAGPAMADNCPSKETVASSKKNNPPYMCAQMDNSGNKSLATLQTKTWTDNVAYGYYVGTWCTYESSSAVTSTVGYYGPSFSDTATNWSTSGTRHFAAGVIFQAGSVDSGQYSTSKKCSSKGWINNSILRITDSVKLDSTPPSSVASGSTVSLSGKLSPSSATGNVGLLVDGEPVTHNGQAIGAQIKSGKFTITWPVTQSIGSHTVQVSYPGDDSKCPQKAETCGYSPQNGKKYTVNVVSGATSNSSASISANGAEPTLLSNPVAPVASASATRSGNNGKRSGLWVATKSSKPHSRLSANCPKGYFPLNGEVFPGNTSRVLSTSSRGIKVNRDRVPGDRRIQIQLTCRKGGKAISGARMGLGTVRADTLRTRKPGAHLMGGPGADTLVVDKRGGVAIGGIGNDRITVKAPNAVASGGPGDDVIRSRTPHRTMLVGGPGKDRIVAGGRARVDVADGEVDTVTCRGDRVWVKADPEDRLGGNCNRI